MEKISGWNNKKLTKRETKLERERERERERVVDNFEGVEERGGNEIIITLCKNQNGRGIVEVDERLNKVTL